MAFSSTIDGKAPLGDKVLAWGTYTNGTTGDTGGNINTGLKTCVNMKLQPKGSSVIATASVVNETFPLAGNAVTIVTSDDEDGYWEAIGWE